MRLAGLAFALFALGCGSSAPGMPEGLVGTYDVMIAGQGKQDPDTMSVSLGSGSSVLLNFVYIGFSQIRANVSGTSQLSIPRQVVKVGMALGALEGPATGAGSIAGDGAVNLMVDVSVPGGAGVDASTTVSYAITGTRRD
jgi:hypothetical protein